MHLYRQSSIRGIENSGAPSGYVSQAEGCGDTKRLKISHLWDGKNRCAERRETFGRKSCWRQIQSVGMEKDAEMINDIDKRTKTEHIDMASHFTRACVRSFHNHCLGVIDAGR